MRFIDWYYSKSRGLFRRMVALHIASKLTLAQRIDFIKYLIRVAQSTNNYVSPEIEQSLCDIADSIDVEPTQSLEIKRKGVLHVATRLKSYGGHSRLLERWIELDTHYMNDVVILDSTSETPPKLISLRQSKGTEVVVLDEGDDIAKARQLRTLASRYDYVVLHVIHIEVVHMLAFGTLKFTKPVLLMNHTDHLFWLGSMIADRILNMSSKARDFTATRRGRSDSVVLPIPLSLEGEQDRSAVCESLGMAPDAKVIFSCGHFYKYYPISVTKSFHWMICKILHNTPSVTVIVVGIKPHKIAWRLLKLYFGERLVLINSCTHSELNHLLYAADIYLDSYPISGFTALCEALAKNIPIIPIDTGFAYFDSLCADLVKPSRVVEQVNKLLFSNAVIDGEKRLSPHLNDEWLATCHSIIKSMPKEHCLHEIKQYSVDVDELSRTFFYQFGGQIASLKFLRCSLPLSIKTRLLLMFLTHPVFMLVSVVFRIRILAYKALF